MTGKKYYERYRVVGVLQVKQIKTVFFYEDKLLNAFICKAAVKSFKIVEFFIHLMSLILL